MYTLIVVLHIVVSVALILVILLQTGKGSDIGAVFGGGSSQTLFGSTGPETSWGPTTSYLSPVPPSPSVPSVSQNMGPSMAAMGFHNSTLPE